MNGLMAWARRQLDVEGYVPMVERLAAMQPGETFTTKQLKGGRQRPCATYLLEEAERLGLVRRRASQPVGRGRSRRIYERCA